jgi:ergothioneine biosynthesis protein EgtB
VTDSPADRLVERFLSVRRATETLAAPLSPEDQLLQSMPEASPVKWHRAHTTWFFEEFLLGPAGVPPLDPASRTLWNSYYEAVGPRHPRPQRGLLSRPSAAEVGAWRRAVDGRVVELLTAADGAALARLQPVVELGLAHEEQHQELILTDLLHGLAQSPLRPAYLPEPPWPRAGPAAPLAWVAFQGGVAEVGAREGEGFAFDNEGPRHRVFLEPFELGDRLVTVGEWKAFAAEGGYQTPSLWLSEGLDWARATGARAPLHARLEGGALVAFGLHGEREAADGEPVAHLSFYEADALARFLGARLPTEAEWEHAAEGRPVEGHLRDGGPLRPLPAPRGDGLRQLFGDCWEWTRSAYEPYPGYRPAAGALGEYNGKFMVSQVVLRGGSCFSPPGHLRASYRNFWPPATRFQVTGLRLARDASRPGGRRDGRG